MVDFVFQLIGSARGLGAYGLVFGVLLACGLGLPLPEDVALMTGGYLASKGQASLGMMMIVGFVGILAGDSLVFFLGRLGRRAEGRLMAGLLARHLTPERVAKVEAQFARRGSLMVVIARFLPGIRAATYFVAGGARMSYARFLFFDGLAALASAPLFVLLGHYLGRHIVTWAKEFHTWLFIAMGVGAVVLLGRWLYLRQRRAKPVAPPARPKGAEVRAAAPVASPAPPTSHRSAS